MEQVKPYPIKQLNGDPIKYAMLADVITHYERLGLGARNWFHPDTMRVWGSRLLHSSVVTNEAVGRTYFVTSEHNFDRSARFYTVRAYDWATADVSTVKEPGESSSDAFLKYKHRSTALRACARVAAAGY